MFTGIITEIGQIRTINKKGDWRVTIASSYNPATIALGASIACAGVCLTVVAVEGDCFKADVSAATLAVTTLGAWREGSQINLERALKVGDELGGHFVSGHVDGVAEVIEVTPVDDSHRLVVAVPKELQRFFVPKGSITLDGVSLTVNAVSGQNVTCNIIPHTWQKTTLGNVVVGTKLNLEVDMLARYARVAT